MSNPRIVKYFKSAGSPEAKVCEVGYLLEAKGYSVDPCATALFVNSGEVKTCLMTKEEAEEVIALVSEQLQDNITSESIRGCARIDVVYQSNK